MPSSVVQKEGIEWEHPDFRELKRREGHTRDNISSVRDNERGRKRPMRSEELRERQKKLNPNIFWKEIFACSLMAWHRNKVNSLVKGDKGQPCKCSEVSENYTLANLNCRANKDIQVILRLSYYINKEMISFTNTAGANWFLHNHNSV